MFKISALVVAGLFIVAGCHSSDPEDDTEITFERNSQFSTQYLRVFHDLKDGTPVSVNTLDDAISTAQAETVIPGHRGQEWMFLKEEDHGTSRVHAVASWNPDDPGDYLMFGWWAYYPGQHPPDLDPYDRQGTVIIDSPEFDHAHPPVMPTVGTASYRGPVFGTYSYEPTDRPADVSSELESFYVRDGWEGQVTLTANFGEGTVSGCIGCDGDLVHRDALVRIHHPDIEFDPIDYEIHLLEHPFNPEDGTIDGGVSEVRHPHLAVTDSDGGWGGFFSNRPDGEGNPRMLGGFGWNSFEIDGGEALLVGAFIGLSEDFASGQ